MQSQSRRRAFAAVSLVVLCAAPAGVILYLLHSWTPTPVPLGNKMPALHLMSIDGHAFVQDTADGKKSLLVFFTPSCSHCRRELTNLDDLLPRFTDKLDILGISLDNLESTEALITEMNLKFPVVVVDDEQLEKTFKVNILPAFFCVDELGVLRNYYTGEHSLAIDEHLLMEFISSSSAP